MKLRNGFVSNSSSSSYIIPNATTIDVFKVMMKCYLKNIGYYDEGDDYTDVAIKLAEKVVLEKVMGVLICGSGVGVCVAANKVDGAMAALCTSEKQARLAREDDNANILCLSSELVDETNNEKIVKIFLETVFSPLETHVRRINKIKEYEKTKINK